MRRKDQNAPKGIEGQKIQVACDDVSRVATHSDFEKLVILGIAAICYLLFRVDPFSFVCQNREKESNIFLLNISAELLPAQNIVEFSERCERKQDLSILECEIKAWRGFEADRSKALTKTFVSKTQRNYAPFIMESSISGVSPRAFALLPTSSSTCWRDGYSPAASSRSQRLNKACIFRFSSGAADS